jgi:hypothetical protein
MNRPDILRLHRELELASKKFEYNSKCISYYLSKEELDKYLEQLLLK